MLVNTDTSMVNFKFEDLNNKKPGVKVEKLKDCVNMWIDKKLNLHILKMIEVVIKDFKIDSNKWKRMMIKFTQNAVQTIKPSSRILNDSIDFNSFIKILILEYPN